MIFGNLNVFLSIFNYLFAEVVMKTAEEVVSCYEPASRFFSGCKLLHNRINALFFMSVQLRSIVMIDAEAKLLTGKQAGPAGSNGKKVDVVFNLSVNDFLVLLLSFED
jgi:hypothetical protein